MPLSSCTVQATAMDCDVDSDSSEDTSNEVIQLTNPNYPTPSIACCNPIDLNAQPPNTAHVPTKLQKTESGLKVCRNAKPLAFTSITTVGFS